MRQRDDILFLQYGQVLLLTEFKKSTPDSQALHREQKTPVRWSGGGGWDKVKSPRGNACRLEDRGSTVRVPMLEEEEYKPAVGVEDGDELYPPYWFVGCERDEMGAPALAPACADGQRYSK